MGLTEKEIARLGPDARRQISEQLSKYNAKSRKEFVAFIPESGFDSETERELYAWYLLPKITSGLIARWELHKEFELFKKSEYCGISLRRMVFTPDFYIEHRSGTIEIIEVKKKIIRKLQRDYPLRRRIFIEKYCRPNGWLYKEIIRGD